MSLMTVSDRNECRFQGDTLQYAQENDLTITAYLWATWLEEDGDGINLLIITPEREIQEERMKDYVKHASPSHLGSDGAPYYPAFTKLKLIPALPDIIQKG